MANDKDRDQEQAGPKVDRRSLIVGGAAAAVTSVTPGDALAASTAGPGEVHTEAAIYTNQKYLDTFTNRYSSGSVSGVQQNIKTLFPVRSNLKWGLYQQKLEPNPANWGSPAAFYHWPDFSQEARDSLERQPAQFNDPKKAMNPFDPTQVAPNLMEHLDEVVRIGLWDHAVPITVEVKKKQQRHHGFYTIWQTSGANPNLQLNGLTLHMDCPDGGWQGFASWHNTDSTQHITRLTSTWQVPPEPQTKDGQIIFIFDGLESVSSANKPGGILQTVLQWTSAGWYVRSWYVSSLFSANNYPNLPNANASQNDLSQEYRCYSKAIPVSVNDMIQGIIAGGVDNNGKFNYQCSIQRNGQPVDANLSMSDIPEPVYAVCAVESYNVGTPASQYYPNPISMSGIDLQVQQSSLSSIPWRTNKTGLGLAFDTTATSLGDEIDFVLS